MKTYSNIQFPKAPIKWRGDEMAVFANHAHEGQSEDGDDVYSADITISKGAELDAIMQAFTRQMNDKALDDAVIYNFEIDGVKAIDREYSQSEQAPTNIFPVLPDKGRLVEGEIYSYGNGAVKVRQTHDRTIYTPEETPDLFFYYRDNTDDLLWVKNEWVEMGWNRMYNGIKYEVIQPHQTLIGMEPDVTPALWKKAPTGEYEVWVQPTGGHDAYANGDIVWYPDTDTTLYKSVIDANVWSPDAYPAGWEVYTP